MIETVGNPRIERNPGGRHYLSVLVNGQPAAIWREQRLIHLGIVVLDGDYWGGVEGNPFENEVAIVPADPASGRNRPEEIRSATTDYRLVQMTRDFITKMTVFEEIKVGPLYR